MRLQKTASVLPLLVISTACSLWLDPGPEEPVPDSASTVRQDNEVAAESKSSPPPEVDEIVVTGTRSTVTDVQDEAQAITAFSMEDLDSAEITNVDQLAFNVPGLHVDARYAPWYEDRESYDQVPEIEFADPKKAPLSTFSIDVDTASYSNVRRFIEDGLRPPVAAVRVEELINYFRYDYPDPVENRPLSLTTEVIRAPWNAKHLIARIGIQGKHVPREEMPPANLVFLVDVSGSMQPADKLPLLIRSLEHLVFELRQQDRVAIAVYAGKAGLVLPSTPGNRKKEILQALSQLQAGGSTAGGAGIKLAYKQARKNFIRGGNNRVILATDGDFNVGASSDEAMTRLIESKRDQGIFLTVLGFGTGNLQDSKMEKIADHGNGNFAYIDSIREARRVLVTELGGTLLTVAKDVKVQIEFNPLHVSSYRLIGYENRALADRDFVDDRKDAGELGAGDSVTALYELILRDGKPTDSPLGPLRYQKERDSRSGAVDELFFAKVRYKLPDQGESQLIEQPVSLAVQEASADTRFAAAVAGFGLLLRDSDQIKDWSVSDAVRLAKKSIGKDPDRRRTEFVELARSVQKRGLLRTRE